MMKWAFASLAMALALMSAPLAAAPSFDCAKVTASVNRMICASPSLSAADAKLANDFDNMRGQGGIDAGKLQADEDAWVRNVKGRCGDPACLAKAYAARDAALLEMSLKAASPAAYEETRPFPVAPDLWAAAQAMIGHDCSGAVANPGKVFGGFKSVKGWLPVLSKGRFVLALQRGGARFAFLLEEPDAKRCHVADVVTLPGPRPRETFLQCRQDAALAYGFGMRQDGLAKAAGFWSMEPGKLVREPLDVLGGKLICQQPETGE